MKTVEELVEKTIVDGDFTIDPATIILIIQIIIEIIKCLQKQGWKNDDILAVCDNPLSNHRSIIKMYFRRRMGLKYSKRFVNQLFETCSQLDYGEVKQIVQDGSNRNV